MTDLPTGTVTFLFTDIEGSTPLLQELGDAYAAVNDDHLAIIGTAIKEAGGVTVRTEGDAFFAAFASALSAVEAALSAQRSLDRHPWPQNADIRVRMGLHTGEGVLGGDDYVGIDVVKAARIAAAGHGGQILLSGPTATLVSPQLPDDIHLRPLGEYHLKGLAGSQSIHQLSVEGLQSEFPPLNTAELVRGNLPEPQTSFVGRQDVLAEAERLLAETRLLTLLGPGGTGKTRLSIELAAEVESDFPDGAFFVPLSAIADPDLVPPAILQSVGKPQSSGNAAPIDQVIEHLRGETALIVLDNFEQILDAARSVASILSECPEVKMIVTSRGPLHISGEQELQVPPLELPDAGKESDPEALLRFESIRLFVERARSVDPAFQITDSNSPTIGAIARRLDGLPLALELAAAKVKLLDPETILERVDARFLAGGSRDREPRQQTMWNAISWSYDLLRPEVQRLFARISVFAGGGRLDELDAVCQTGQELDIDLLEGLEELIDQSLLRRLVSFPDLRFSMLGPLRDFGAERLDALREVELIRARHARVYREFAETARDQLLGRERGKWLDRVEVEHDNLRAALQCFTEGGHTKEALNLVFTLWRFWQARGHVHEGRARVEEVLGMEGGSVSARGRALEAAGGLAYWQGDFEATTRSYDHALELARENGDPKQIADALLNSSFTKVLTEDFDPAFDALEEAEAAYTQLGDDSGLGNVDVARGNIYRIQGELVPARDSFASSTNRLKAAGDYFGAAWSIYSTATALGELGEVQAAYPHLDEALEIFTEAGDQSAMGLVMVGYSFGALAEGKEARAARLWGTVLGLSEEAGIDLITDNPFLGQRKEAISKLIAHHPDEFQAGKALSSEEAVALALKRD